MKVSRKTVLLTGGALIIFVAGFATGYYFGNPFRGYKVKYTFHF